ncbi:restriction endonuclease subunit S [Enterobacter hormaechei]|uniref:restriction endonuclease subunit S n=1 Tax=Enterobacter hormaechei TaxID=158836 RepID=UPI0011E3EBB6|nr:restriction endonuclease subunit S [Enterobacter hormaechei]TYF99778.1 restriction endonuclease subunit S [Enterobacter hormaechei]
MIEVSYLVKLLDGDSVDWISLGKIAEYSTTRVNAIELDATSFTGVDNLVASKGGRINANYLPNTTRLTAYEPGDILLGNIRPYLKKVWLATNSGGCSGDVLAIRIRDECRSFVNPSFLYFILSSDSFFSYSMQYAKGAKMPRGSKADILNYEIPVPCPDQPEKSLAIQSEIVRILDKFTALTTELIVELTMRKKQYDYYRNQLLSFNEEEAEWKTLGEIVKMRAGQHISARNIVDRKEGDFVYPCFGGNGIRGYVKEKSHDGEHLLIGRQGALCGNVQRMKGQFYATEHAVVVSAMQGIDIDWAFHMLTTMNLNQYASKSAQPGLAVGKLQELKLLVPSIERQKYIAKMLDKFDTLTGSITEGLPHEINLRQKQFEYYRDLLFSFPKSETASN